jgi:hypothetical protein
MKKTLIFKFLEKEYANFSFLSDKQKRKNYSSMSLHGISKLFLDRRGYATNKQPYNEEMRIIYINFVKALLHNKLNLQKSKFNNYGEIIKFLEEFQGDKLFSKPYISKLKSDGQFSKVPFSEKSEQFIFYVKKKFPNFNEAKFILPYPGSEETPGKLKNKLTNYKVKGSEMNNKGYPLLGRVFNKTYPTRNNTFGSINLLYTISTFLFLMLPYSILFLLAIKDNPSELFSFIEELDSDSNRADDYTHKDLDNQPWYESTSSDFYPSIEGLSSEYNEEIPQRGHYIDGTSSGLDYYKGGEKKLLDKTTSNKSSWLFPMLDFNNLNYFPSLFEDLSKPKDTYIIVKQIGSNAMDNAFNYSTGTNSFDQRYFNKVSSLPQKNSSPILTLDIPYKEDALILDSYSTPKSLSYDSASSTFSKYFYYADTTVPSLNEVNSSPLKTDSKQIDLREGTLVEHSSKKKTVSFQVGEDSLNSSPQIPNRLSKIEPLFPYDGDNSALELISPLRKIDMELVESSRENFWSTESYHSDDDPVVPDIKTVRDTPVYPDNFSDLTDYSLTRHSSNTYSAGIENTTSLHKLNTNVEVASPAQVDLLDQLFRKKVLIEDINNRISQLEMQNIDFNHKIASLEWDRSLLTRDKIELTKQFNINNIKAVDPVPSNIIEKYKDAYLSVTNKNHSITLKVREIKEKLTFLDNAKLSLLKDLEINVKCIADFKNDQAKLIKSVQDIEKITGNISRTPLH